MKQVDYWLWWITSERTGKRVRTSFRMTEAVARERYPDAERIEGTCETRTVPENDRERAEASPGRWLHYAPGQKPRF